MNQLYYNAILYYSSLYSHMSFLNRVYSHLQCPWRESLCTMVTCSSVATGFARTKGTIRVRMSPLWFEEPHFTLTVTYFIQIEECGVARERNKDEQSSNKGKISAEDRAKQAGAEMMLLCEDVFMDRKKCMHGAC